MLESHLSESYLATITNYYRRHGFEFDCNQEAMLVRGVKPLIDFNSSSIWWWLLDMERENPFEYYFFNFGVPLELSHVDFVLCEELLLSNLL